MSTEQKKLRGFAAMDKEKLRAISRKGMVVLQTLGLQHQYTPEEAREAYRKGYGSRFAGRRGKP